MMSFKKPKQPKITLVLLVLSLATVIVDKQGLGSGTRFVQD